jgi:hypothetical protein
MEPLTHKIEIRRTKVDGEEYVVILIRKPLSDDEILSISEFLYDIDPDSGWHYRKAVPDANTA